MTDHEVPDDQLARFLSGEASAADRVAVETWAAADPAHRATLERLLTATAQSTASDWDVDRAWQRVANTIQSPTGEVLALERRSFAWGPAVLRIAALLLVVIGAVFAWQQLKDGAGPTVYATAQGERLEVSLPDGSLAVLGPSSSLSVPEDFGTDHRRLGLAGEAWFQASHSGPAFEVRSGEYLVRDIGTVFTVTARPDAPLRVMVVEGEVEVRIAADTATLLASLGAGDVGDFTRPSPDLEAEAIIASDQPVASLASWHAGTLELIDVPAQEVIDRLAAWHGVAITIAPEQAQGRTITATLPLDSLDAALDIIAPLLGAQAVRGPDGVRLQ